MAMNRQPKYGMKKRKNYSPGTIRLSAAESKARKQAAEKTLVELSNKGWPGFSSDATVTRLAVEIAEKKATPYSSYQAVNQILQKLLDTDRIKLPGTRR